MVFRYYQTSADALDAYQQGDVLSVSQITSDVLNTALEESNLSVYTSRLPQISFVLFNLNNPEVAFLQNAKVRRALMFGLNRSYMINRFLQGQAVTTDGPILPGSWAYYDGIEHFEFNPDELVNLLKGEGYVIPAEGGDVRAKEGTALSFTMLHPDDAIHTKIAETIRDEWAHIGVQIKLQAVPYDKLATDFLASRTYQAALVDLNLARPTRIRIPSGIRRKPQVDRTTHNGITAPPANISSRRASRQITPCGPGSIETSRWFLQRSCLRCPCLHRFIPTVWIYRYRAYRSRRCMIQVIVWQRSQTGICSRAVPSSRQQFPQLHRK